MSEKRANKAKILIVDDSEMNRAILADMLEDDYEILEAENGVQGVTVIQQHIAELSLVLLDIVMPEMDGFGVLEAMNQYHWIEDLPVIMISAESGSSHVEQAYELGATDFVSRPFDPLIVHRRVINTILLYAKQKKLIGLVADQIYEKEQRSSLMIDILSHIVEFRNCESGNHVLRVRTITDLLLRWLAQRDSSYQLSKADISVIADASALHDIGKIAVDEKVLNKPGKLTPEEFEHIKTHTVVGGQMLRDMPIHQGERLVEVAYEICRWHHERYDGRGYPDGLVGDTIPISAQVVALADVYDALTSERVYKPAFSHEQAVNMIVEGKCGVFNPKLLNCLAEISDTLKTELENNTHARRSQQEMRNVAEEMLRHEELTASERTLQLLEHERMKYSFFAALTEEIQFEYTLQPPMLTLTAWGAERLGVPEIMMDPVNDERTLMLIDRADLQKLTDDLRSTSPGSPVVTCDCQVNYSGDLRWSRIIARATWSSDEPPRYMGCIGKAMDIHNSRLKLESLERQASHDGLTGLLNHAYARKRILERLEERPDGRYALAILDLDHFKSANDTYGHMFGDEVLKHLADLLRSSARGGDIAARVGGDEFLIFLEYKTDLEPAVKRIYNKLASGRYQEFDFSVSMGVAMTETVGTDYDALFHAADQTLYTVKQSSRGHYRFYSEGMEQALSAVSPIDGSADENSAGATTHEEEQV